MSYRESFENMEDNTERRRGLFRGNPAPRECRLIASGEHVGREWNLLTGVSPWLMLRTLTRFFRPC